MSTGAILLAPLPVAQETSGKVCRQFGCHSLVGGLVSGFQSVKPERLLNDPHSQGLTVKNKRLRGSSGPSTPQAPSCLGLACLLLEAPPPALLGQLLPVPPTSGHPPRPPQARGPDTLFTSSSRQSLEVSAAPLDGGSHTPTEQLLREQGRREWTKARTQVCRQAGGTAF